MAIELRMPALSPTMEKGTLAKWLVTEGDSVKPGDVIAEIETDKATMEFEAIDEGVIASLVVPEGTVDVAVGTVIALIGEAGEVAPAKVLETVTSAPVTGLEVAAPPSIAEIAHAIPAPADTPVPKSTPAADNRDVNASPLARRIATIKGLSLLGITGTGTRGRIVKADLGLPSLLSPGAHAAAPPAPFAAPAVVAVQPPPADVPFETMKLSGMRKTIARRLTESKQTVPHFYLTARCNIDALLKLRSELNASIVDRGVKLSINDFMLKAMALAMTEVPDANVQFGGDELHRFGRVDISMAVAIDGGLITPILKDVASLSLSGIAKNAKALAAKARDGKLLPEDYQGGTASISNLGMFGIDELFPVINPPQALILGVGAGVEQPWKVDNEIAIATILACTASFDHRAIDGAVAAQFMAVLRDHIEHPLTLIC